MFKPSVTLSLGKERKQKNTDVLNEEPTPDYAAIAEEAAVRVGKKLVIGTLVILAANVILTTASTLVINAFDNTNTSE